MRIPRHLAIIMDGNGRWAEQRRLPRIAGHGRGVETVQEIVRECRSLGVSCLTLYAFSSENWGRPKEEVSALMSLLGRYLKSELKTMLNQDIRLHVIGDAERLPATVRSILQDAVRKTAGNRTMVLNLALSYGSRNEILRTVRQLAWRVREGGLDPGEIDEKVFEASLDTAGMADPDLLIRTSGEMRISNFLLWQLAYTELYFCDVLWPEFDTGELHRAFREFGRRQRRFGLTGSQVDDGGGNFREDGH